MLRGYRQPRACFPCGILTKGNQGGQDNPEEGLSLPLHSATRFVYIRHICLTYHATRDPERMKGRMICGPYKIPFARKVAL